MLIYFTISGLVSKFNCDTFTAIFQLNVATTRLGGRNGIQPVKTERWGAGAAWLSAWSEVQDLHMSQLMPLPLTVSCFSKIKIGLPFWYQLTWVVPEKGPLNGCVCVCVTTMAQLWYFVQ